jgi:putative PEP-CTERM system histidine kinase
MLSTSWRGRLEGGLLLLAVIMCTLWSLVLGWHEYNNGVYDKYAFIIETLRNVAIYAFLFSLLKPFFYLKGKQQLFNRITFLVYLGSIIFIGLVASYGYSMLLGGYRFEINIAYLFSGNLIMSVFGLFLVEQLYRNTGVEKRWAVKFLFIGIGLIFVYDFFMYSDALLFSAIDDDIWTGRGFVVSMSVPMLAISAVRNPKWTVEVFVSKQIVFHATALIGIGIYLLLMAAAGYYINLHGGDWGVVAQIVFLSLALLLLLVVIFSGEIRAKVKFFINKHFFHYKYDYRDEWLKITNALSQAGVEADLNNTVVNSIADLIECQGGMLWLLNEDRSAYQCVTRTYLSEVHELEPTDGNLAVFLQKNDLIIDLDEYLNNPEVYEGLMLPEWLQNLKGAWLVIPMRHLDTLYGFIILSKSRAESKINWEDRELLQTACKQAAGYLVLQETSVSLAKAEKFAVFNRLSAYVVHDLKNLIAQLDLITRNAKSFKHNPEFVDDAFETVKFASQKMGRLLAQLKQGRFSSQAAVYINIQDAMEEVVRNHNTYLPHPQLHCTLKNVRIMANPDRFLSVVGHLIKNAQEATEDEGYVKVDVRLENDMVIITVTDNGCGMTEVFIKEKLFTPFFTTKGNAGMGVGAYECRDFIESLGGRVEVNSIPGKGSEFRLSIPATTEHEKQVEARE